MIKNPTTIAYLVGGMLVGSFLWYSLEHRWMTPEGFHEEAVKIALQVFVVGLVGGVAQFVLDQRKQLRAFRADILERLGRVHRAIYRVRRLYAGADTASRHSLLGELMDARQDLGAIPHTVRILGYTEFLKTILAEVKLMRAFLEALIEAALPGNGGPQDKTFLDFLDWRDTEKNKHYVTNFKEPYLRAKRLVDPSFDRSN